jgi:hypothetical protein
LFHGDKEFGGKKDHIKYMKYCDLKVRNTKACFTSCLETACSVSFPPVLIRATGSDAFIV